MPSHPLPGTPILERLPAAGGPADSQARVASKEKKPAFADTRKDITEAFARLTKQGRLELAHLTDASKASISMLDSLIAKLQAKRFKCAVQIQKDEDEVVVLQREIAKSETRMLKFKESLAENKKEYDLMVKSRKDALETMVESVAEVRNNIRSTNVNIVKMTRTQVPQGRPDYTNNFTHRGGTGVMGGVHPAATMGRGQTKKVNPSTRLTPL